MVSLAPALGYILRVEPALAEAAMSSALWHPEVAASAEAAEYRRGRESLYATVAPADRDAAFGRLALAGFEALDLAGPIRQAISERPALVRGARVVLLGAADGRLEEGVTCEPGGRHLGMRVEVHRFDEPAGLLAWARHGLGHAEDTLDPEFAFEPGWDAVAGRTAGATARARLHRLWDVTVDARLAAAGHLDSGPAFQRHREALAADLQGVDTSTIEAAVAYLWTQPRPAFRDILAWAEQPLRLVRVVAPDEPGLPQPDRCPLCAFPSRDVVPPEARIAKLVVAEYSAWRPKLGLCGHCTDRYRLAGRHGRGARS